MPNCLEVASLWLALIYKALIIYDRNELLSSIKEAVYKKKRVSLQNQNPTRQQETKYNFNHFSFVDNTS